MELAFPGWFGLTDLIEDDEGFHLRPGDPEHDRMRAIVAVASGLYEDPDADGDLGHEERADGSVASGARRPDDRGR